MTPVKTATPCGPMQHVFGEARDFFSAFLACREAHWNKCTAIHAIHRNAWKICGNAPALGCACRCKPSVSFHCSYVGYVRVLFEEQFTMRNLRFAFVHIYASYTWILRFVSPASPRQRRKWVILSISILAISQCWAVIVLSASIMALISFRQGITIGLIQYAV